MVVCTGWGLEKEDKNIWRHSSCPVSCRPRLHVHLTVCYVFRLSNRIARHRAGPGASIPGSPLSGRSTPSKQTPDAGTENRRSVEASRLLGNV